MWGVVRSSFSMMLLLGCGSSPVDAGESSTTANSDGSADSSTTRAATSDGSSSSGANQTTSSVTSGNTGTSDQPTTSGCGTACDEGEPIAVAAGYGSRRMRSADGIAWTDFVEVDPKGGDDDNLLRGIGYGDGVFLAVGGAGQGLSMTSFDGRTWIDENHAPSSFLSDTVYFDGTFVAAGGNGLRARTEDYGQTWTEETGYFAGHFRALAAGSDRVVAVGHTYEGEPLGLWSVSTQSGEWDGEHTGGQAFAAIAFGAGTFVAVGREGRVSASVDGVTWTDAKTSANEIEGVAFVDGMFYVAAGTHYLVSPDGAQWSESASSPRAFPILATLGGAGLSTGWPAEMFRSSSFDAWESVHTVGGPGFTDIAVGVPREDAW